MYQRKVDVDMLNAIKSVLAHVLSISPSSEQRAESLVTCEDEGLTLKTSANTSAYPHQPYVDTLYILPPRRRRPKLVLTGTSIPLCIN